MIDKWDQRFLELAKLIASWSKDPSTKVGAVIVSPILRHVVGVGYNGFPRGVKDLAPRYYDRSIKYEMVVHAEVNALHDAGKEARGCVLYCTFMPCPQCAAQLIQAGISKIYVQPNPADERWKEKFKITETMLEEAGIPIEIIKDE